VRLPRRRKLRLRLHCTDGAGAGPDGNPPGLAGMCIFFSAAPTCAGLRQTLPEHAGP